VFFFFKKNIHVGSEEHQENARRTPSIFLFDLPSCFNALIDSKKWINLLFIMIVYVAMHLRYSLWRKDVNNNELLCTFYVLEY
jgi:hypothetical protein